MILKQSDFLNLSYYFLALFTLFFCDTFCQQVPALYAPSAPASGILTPASKAIPQVNGPAVFGVRPGSPFLYSIPASGKRPLKFSAHNLPAGLTLDQATGRITGKLTKTGRYAVTLFASNELGKATKNFTIVVGEEIALTPSMGWNSYNAYGVNVDQQKATLAAKAMIRFKLNEHGWTYINLDDGWQGERDPATLALMPDPARFSNMKVLCDSIHLLGLKPGLYSSPWTKTYGSRTGGSAMHADGSKDSTYYRKAPRNKKVLPYHIGPYSFARQDAQQWAAWGIDYVKYDWAPVEVTETKEMYDALRSTQRDIVLSLSNNHPLTLINNIQEVSPYAQSWRTTTDINETWKRVSDIGFNQDAWAAHARPGHFTDPDMLVVGYVGWHQTPRPTKLTPDEQYTHISLWCLLASPLLLGCDLEKLDDFTISLLTNDEVLGIDQDALGKQASRVSSGDSTVVYSKPLEDGSIAFGMFNRSLQKKNVKVLWRELGIKGNYILHDLWRQNDIGMYQEVFEAEVPPHGVVLLKARSSNQGRKTDH